MGMVYGLLKQQNQSCNTITILQYYNTTILQYYNITILQYYNTITILQYYNTTILQYYYNTTILQYYYMVNKLYFRLLYLLSTETSFGNNKTDMIKRFLY